MLRVVKAGWLPGPLAAGRGAASVVWQVLSSYPPELVRGRGKFSFKLPLCGLGCCLRSRQLCSKGRVGHHLGLHERSNLEGVRTGV